MSCNPNKVLSLCCSFFFFLACGPTATSTVSPLDGGRSDSGVTVDAGPTGQNDAGPEVKDAGPSCDVTTCPTGCCNAGKCVAGNTAVACGTGGETCDACAIDEQCSNQKCEPLKPPPTKCDATSCPNGCCNGDFCDEGTSTSACGKGGIACTTCSAGQQCTNQKCETPPPPPPPPPSCGPSNCATGCCNGTQCVQGTSTLSCGTGGLACSQCGSGQTCTNQQCTNPFVCNPTTCPTGCCDGNQCVNGTSTTACGSGGLACTACGSNQTCTSQACINNPVVTCNAANCPSGCCSGNSCVQGTSTSACGKGGLACTTCGSGQQCTNQQCVTPPPPPPPPSCNAANCPSGCCSGNSCVQGTSTSACGTGGLACTTCASGQQCTNKQCVTPPPPPASLGSACTQDSDCTAVGGNPSICKTSTSYGNLQYAGGFCTRRCLRDSECGSNGLCLIGLGPIGEADNICVPQCQTTGDCRANGYTCLDFGTAQTPINACWIAAASYEPVDPGTAVPNGISGAACTTDAQCPPTPGGLCKPDSSGYPGGACTANCSYASDPAFCGSNGTCVGYAVEIAPGEDPGVIFLCEQSCSPTNPCRTGYACDTGGASAVCVPRCDTPGAPACPSGTSCTNGLCQ